jgi:hypothetical protein
MSVDLLATAWSPPYLSELKRDHVEHFGEA